MTRRAELLNREIRYRFALFDRTGYRDRHPVPTSGAKEPRAAPPAGPIAAADGPEEEAT